MPSAVCTLSSLPFAFLITPYGPAPVTTGFNHGLLICFPHVSFADVLVSLDGPSCRSVTTASGEVCALSEVHPVDVGSTSSVRWI